ncbi:hypothetical protein [Hufsiella ginkgonis]|uniref:Uncharacterized protein n=1 Tax=Hufsiella ginkgonis TaxID=2695274 RepID=A0A7K1XUA8_9SPHI|nr:hypothetical protein [Hufsiella ginkgonis]MXV14388.1 hypothetical protein [Hufsiella ginkgonis]
MKKFTTIVTALVILIATNTFADDKKGKGGDNPKTAWVIESPEFVWGDPSEVDFEQPEISFEAVDLPDFEWGNPAEISLQAENAPAAVFLGTPEFVWGDPSEEISITGPISLRAFVWGDSSGVVIE